MGKSVNFKSQQAFMNVFLWEKKNGSILTLCEPNIVSVVELIKLGSGVKKEDEAIEILVDLMEDGKGIKEVSYDLIRQSAHLTVAGSDGAEKIIQEIESRMANGLSSLDEVSVEEPKPAPVVAQNKGEVREEL